MSTKPSEKNKNFSPSKCEIESFHSLMEAAHWDSHEKEDFDAGTGKKKFREM